MNDLLGHFGASASALTTFSTQAPKPITPEALGEPKREWLTFLKPSEIVAWVPPKDFMLMGDCHLTRGGITVLGGPPGVGKSRAALALAIAGATGKPWMGHAIHHRFRTLIIQAENGRFRLKSEVGGACAHPAEFDQWIEITSPPPLGIAFSESEFRNALRDKIEAFRPGLIVFDPWNRATDGDKAADYRMTLDHLGACLPERDEEKPAILILHHMRKRSGEATGRKHGRALLDELAGSYQLGSAARCVFAVIPVSNDTRDQTVALYCCKNNDGMKGDPSAWIVRNGPFEPVPDFDWDAFHATPEPGGGRKISDAVIAAALSGMWGESRKQGVARLVGAGVGQSKAYELFAEGTRHPGIEEDANGKFYWKGVA